MNLELYKKNIYIDVYENGKWSREVRSIFFPNKENKNTDIELELKDNYFITESYCTTEISVIKYNGCKIYSHKELDIYFCLWEIENFINEVIILGSASFLQFYEKYEEFFMNRRKFMNEKILKEEFGIR